MTTPQGRLKGIALRNKSRAPMEEREEAEITVDEGVVGDYRGKPGARQVTVLAMEDWKTACAELDQELPWTVRRANLLVEGLQFQESSVGSRIVIGDVTLEVAHETDPCHRMDEAASGLLQALTPDWRGGVCCRVVEGGVIRIGSVVTSETK